MILRLALDLPEDKEYVRTTRKLSLTLLEDLQVKKSDCEDVALIVSELCANVVRHARSDLNRFTVMLEYFRDKVVISVEDHGDGFTPDALPEPGKERSDLDGGTRIGGFGLPLLEAISDRLEFKPTEPQGMTVQAEKALHYETRAAHARAGEMDRGDEAKVTVEIADISKTK